MSGPLAGVRVLDLTQFFSGPFCTMVLADLGADVVKVERPGGEPQRNAMRPAGASESHGFLILNRNKRGVELDLARPDGLEAFLALVRTADVLVENFRPGVTARLGIDYETVRQVRPELIYATITGFGERGPWADRPGLDAVAQAMSGLMSVTGHPGSGPAKIGVPATDLTAGLFCAVGIVAAYHERTLTGVGRRVSTSLFEAGLALGIHEAAEYWSTGRTPGPLGSGHRFAAPYRALRTLDGHVTIGAGTDKLWRQLCPAIGRDDLLADPRFGSNEDRMANLDALVEELERTLVGDTSERWTARIVAAGVPAGPILDYPAVLESPHAAAVDMVVEVDHPTAGRVRTLGSAVKLDGAGSNGVRPAPTLGQHTAEVLGELGIEAAR
jgi:crotonobetainyl-CoA:carnitine CoA-transferase CaiB-like acyl-CoA transferase